MNSPLDTQKSYQQYVNKKSPNSPILKNCFNAFCIGGIICSLGQIIFSFCSYKGLDETTSRHNCFYNSNWYKRSFNCP